MTECLTLNVQEQDSGDGGTDEPEREGSPEIPTLSAPSSANSGEEFTVSYQVCCNEGTCPYGFQLYVNSEEVHSEDINLSSECTSGSIGVTIEGNGQYTLTLIYGNRAMDRTVEIVGDDTGGDDGVTTDPGDGFDGGDDDLLPGFPGDGDGSPGDEPDTSPQLPLGLSRNQALAIGGGALGIVALSSGSGRPRPVRYIRGDQ